MNPGRKFNCPSWLQYGQCFVSNGNKNAHIQKCAPYTDRHTHTRLSTPIRIGWRLSLRWKHKYIQNHRRRKGMHKKKKASTWWKGRWETLAAQDRAVSLSSAAEVRRQSKIGLCPSTKCHGSEWTTTGSKCVCVRGKEWSRRVRCVACGCPCRFTKGRNPEDIRKYE